MNELAKIIAVLLIVLTAFVGCSNDQPNAAKTDPREVMVAVYLYKSHEGVVSDTDNPLDSFTFTTKIGNEFKETHEYDGQEVILNGVVTDVPGDKNAFHVVIGYKGLGDVPPNYEDPCTFEVGQIYVHNTFPSYDGIQFRYKMKLIEEDQAGKFD